jgi:AraC-like DNA-binding protein
MPLVEISASLGYADASAFTRAFRRWTGTTPTAWPGTSVARTVKLGSARRDRVGAPAIRG